MKNKSLVVYFKQRYSWLLIIINMYLVNEVFDITRSPLDKRSYWEVNS